MHHHLGPRRVFLSLPNLPAEGTHWNDLRARTGLRATEEMKVNFGSFHKSPKRGAKALRSPLCSYLPLPSETVSEQASDVRGASESLPNPALPNKCCQIGPFVIYKVYFHAALNIPLQGRPVV